VNFLWRVYFEPHRDIGNIGFVSLVEGLEEGVVEGLVEGVVEGVVEGLVEGVVVGVVVGVVEELFNMEERRHGVTRRVYIQSEIYFSP